MTRTRLSSESEQALIDYLEAHREDIKFAKKGYISKVFNGFKDESGIELTLCQFRRILEYFRIKHDCPLQYCPSKYYIPVRKRASLGI